MREDRWTSAKWWSHPNNASNATDVAVASIDFHEEEEFARILLRSTDNGQSSLNLAGTAEVLADRRIGVGDEISIIGLFRSHFGEQKNVPIVRVGNIAMMKSEPVYTKYCGYTEAYLIEARSTGGLSGSPVFVHAPLWRLVDSQIKQNEGTALYLLGLMHGHFDIQNINEDVASDTSQSLMNINTGVGVVIPVEKILETIDRPELVALRRKALNEHKAKLTKLRGSSSQ